MTMEMTPPKICRTHEAFLRRGLDAWKWRSTSFQPELKLTLQKSGAAIPAVLVKTTAYSFGVELGKKPKYTECLEYLFELAIEASKAGIKIY
ncbi:unnamed protein product, partial [Mesorhabditis spiculigera]